MDKIPYIHTIRYSFKNQQIADIYYNVGKPQKHQAK